jgi:hypothetical protein
MSRQEPAQSTWPSRAPSHLQQRVLQLYVAVDHALAVAVVKAAAQRGARQEGKEGWGSRQPGAQQAWSRQAQPLAPSMLRLARGASHAAAAAATVQGHCRKALGPPASAVRAPPHPMISCWKNHRAAASLSRTARCTYVNREPPDANSMAMQMYSLVTNTWGQASDGRGGAIRGWGRGWVGCVGSKVRCVACSEGTGPGEPAVHGRACRTLAAGTTAPRRS